MSSSRKSSKKIEKAVVSGYKAVENGVVNGYKKIEDKFVSTFLTDDDSGPEEGGKTIPIKTE